MLLVAGFIMDNGTVTQGAGLESSRFDASLNMSRDAGISLHYELQTTAGAKSVSNWALSSGTDPNYGVIFALRPAPTSGVSLTINVPTRHRGGRCHDRLGRGDTKRDHHYAPSGWTLIRQVTQASATSSALATYYRVADGRRAGELYLDVSTLGLRRCRRWHRQFQRRGQRRRRSTPRPATPRQQLAPITPRPTSRPRSTTACWSRFMSWPARPPGPRREHDRGGG